MREYFRLGDLWDCYDELSVYGFGSQVDLKKWRNRVHINELAEKYPGLMTLGSVDMSHASWMAVTWYPIYHSPTCKNEKDLTTCFSTYHTLSSSFQDNVVEGDDSNTESKEETECCEESVVNKRITLPLFGLATYKMQGDLWGKTEFHQDRLLYLQSTEDSWLITMTFTSSSTPTFKTLPFL
ncbi:hypothetical protein F2Q69_00050467 [Brassica cretica]|uniref:Uncharacterized protein n=1 Tax=Brassica cretica TaxID=69181 RepID=A0A8S9Q344_BRACR|nr:hypothetical protein F2Q69_00050467 [Brassica cretica]